MLFRSADIPGLIEGAHEGVGLGFTFLRHIERTRIILHVLDLSSEDVLADYQVVANELAAYNEELLERTTLVILNKADIAEEQDIESIQKSLKEKGLESAVISGLTGDGIEDLKERIENFLDTYKDSTI